MQCWSDACLGEKKQFEAMSMITVKSPHLLDFLFDSQKPKLKHSPDQLMKAAQGFSSGDYILVKLCLDLWCEHGKIKVHELFSLDQELFLLVLKTMAYLANPA